MVFKHWLGKFSGVISILATWMQSQCGDLYMRGQTGKIPCAYKPLTACLSNGRLFMCTL